VTQVKDIMSTELVTVSPELSLRDLVELLANAHLGGVPVLSHGEAVGVVSLDDIASFQASLAPVPTDGAEEIGWDEESPPGMVEGEESVSAYFQDLWADAGANVIERTEAIRGPEWDLLAEHVVDEAMSRRLWTIGPNETVQAAARQMRQHDIHRLLVMEDGRLLGIVTTSDVTRAVAEGKA
jgi:CBS domain-containing protein